MAYSKVCGKKLSSWFWRRLLDAADSEDIEIELEELLLPVNGAGFYRSTFNNAVKFKGCQLKVLKLFLEKDVALTCKILNYAVKSKGCSFEIVKWLIEKGGELSTHVLIDAVKSEECQFAVIKLLLENGAKLTCDILNDSVKSKACNFEVVKLLIENGAKLSNCVLNDAVQSKGCNIEVINLLLENNAMLTPNILANALLSNQGCDFEIIKLLLKYGAIVDKLILLPAIASQKCDVKILQLLLESGADLPCDVLKFTVRSGGCNLDVIKFLVKNGANITPCLLEHALSSKNCNFEAIKFILECGVELTRFTLHSICNGNFEITKLLLEYGAHVNNDVYKSKKISSLNMNKSKILFQYFLVQRFIADSTLTDECLRFELFFDLSDFDSVLLYRDMLNFFISVVKELFKMKQDKIDHSSSLFSFVSLRCSCAPDFHIRQDYFEDEVLSRLLSDQYPSCYNLLCASFSENYISDKIGRLDIYAKKNNPGETLHSGKISLNSDTTSYLVSYLSKGDRINLMLAFWPKNNCGDLKRKCDSGVAIDELDSSIKKLKQ